MQCQTKVFFPPQKNCFISSVFPKFWLTVLFLSYTGNTKTAISLSVLKNGIPHKKRINQASESFSNLILLETVWVKSIWELQLLRQVIFFEVWPYIWISSFCNWFSCILPLHMAILTSFLPKNTVAWSGAVSKEIMGQQAGSYRSAFLMVCLEQDSWT